MNASQLADSAVSTVNKVSGELARKLTDAECTLLQDCLENAKFHAPTAPVAALMDLYATLLNVASTTESDEVKASFNKYAKDLRSAAMIVR